MEGEQRSAILPSCAIAAGPYRAGGECSEFRVMYSCITGCGQGGQHRISLVRPLRLPDATAWLKLICCWKASRAAMVYTVPLPSYTAVIAKLMQPRLGWACLQLLTEVSLQALIWGSIAAAFSQVGELLAAGIDFIWPNSHSPLQDHGGRWLILISIAAIAPASTVKHIHAVLASPQPPAAWLLAARGTHAPSENPAYCHLSVAPGSASTRLCSLCNESTELLHATLSSIALYSQDCLHPPEIHNPHTDV